ncbi:MAG: YceD family protein [Marinagarivorans sp.]|nr:YceD family protein [Marinagarivorans sp.]
MSDSSPKKIIPQFVEPRKFSVHGVTLSGEIPGHALKRLAEAAVVVDGLQAELEFFVDIEKRRAVQGHVHGDILVQCQRCLEEMPYTLDARINWAVVWSEDQAEKLPSSIEAWIAGEDAEDLYVMVEEELLLVMPVAPVHSEQCIDESLMQTGEPPVEEVSSIKSNPFQALAALKGTTKN